MLRKATIHLAYCLNDEKKDTTSERELLRAAKFAARQQCLNDPKPLKIALQHLLGRELTDVDIPETAI